MTEAPITIHLNLCINDCRHGASCPGYSRGETPGGGVTCLRYEADPARLERAPDRAVMAMPDREPCADCVTRKGTWPNGTHHSTEAFRACVEHGGIFTCVHDGDGQRLCAGWLRARKRKIEARERAS